MGEVLDIYVVTKKIEIYKEIYSILLDYVKKENIRREIKKMDNWAYENETVVNGDINISDIIDNKIVCIYYEA
ncbi:MAG: hypothetical protein K6G26_10945, partial [Lachnospiraceae bacterium]|nr:hypothetical protein [Lachnospiraceae bacterium]